MIMGEAITVATGGEDLIIRTCTGVMVIITIGILPIIMAHIIPVGTVPGTGIMAIMGILIIIMVIIIITITTEGD